MKAWMVLVVGLVPAVAGAAALRADPPIKCESCEAWNAPQEPFRVFGNTYYVGVAGLSAVLVTSQAGLVLLARGLLTDSSVLEGREVYCLAEEVQELGLEGKLPAAVKPLPAREVITLFSQRPVLSLD